MTLDNIEKSGLDRFSENVSGKLEALNKSFKSSLAPESGVFLSNSELMGSNIIKSLGLTEIVPSELAKTSAFDAVKEMYDGKNGRSLKKISEYKVNPKCEYSNLKQHAGYAAERISTTRENLKVKLIGKGDITYCVEDLTDEMREKFGNRFKKNNDEYVDKVKVNAKGEITEKIQSKFVGENAEKCYEQLKSKEFQKYFDPRNENGEAILNIDGAQKVDTVEIPKDYFYDSVDGKDGVEKLLQKDIDKFQKSFNELTAEGKTDEARNVKAELDKLKIIENLSSQALHASFGISLAAIRVEKP